MERPSRWPDTVTEPGRDRGQRVGQGDRGQPGRDMGAGRVRGPRVSQGGLGPGRDRALAP